MAKTLRHREQQRRNPGASGSREPLGTGPGYKKSLYGKPKSNSKPKQKEIPVQITPLFLEMKDYLNEQEYLILRGGAGSSKSHSIMQVLVERLYTIRDRQILVLRKTLPSLRLSTLPLIDKYLSELGLIESIQISRQFLNYYNPQTKALIHFGSLDDPEKVKSSEWNDIWMEEATEFSYDDFIVLETRLRAPRKDPSIDPPNQMFLSFNPEDEFHWIKSRLINSPNRNLIEIASNYKHNPFLPESYVQRLLALEEQDPNYYRIFALGEWGRLEGLIYSNWDVVEKMPPDEFFDTIIWGLDFGFVNPCAALKIGIKENDIWEEECLYQTGLTNTELILRMKQLIPDPYQTQLYCDSAEQDRIRELQDAGFVVYSAEKGSGSVKIGIDVVKRFRIHVTRGSLNLLKEKRTYSWRKDPRSGRFIEEPVKWNDHLMDAERYAIHTHMKYEGAMESILRWI